MCFSCKKKSENEAPCFWSLVGLVWSKPARPTRLRKASCLLPALRPKGKFYFLILFFVLCGIWKSVKRLCLNWEFILWAFPYDLHFFLMDKKLDPEDFLAWIKNDHEENWIPSACQSRINCIPFHIHESVLQLLASPVVLGAPLFDVDFVQVHS